MINHVSNHMILRNYVVEEPSLNQLD